MLFSQMQKTLREDITRSSHVIIKLGTNTIAPHIHDASLEFFYELAAQIKGIQDSSKKVLLVSSGAVGLGKRLILESEKETLKNKQFSLTERQAFASLGQSRLMELYRCGFAEYSLLPAQILVSGFDFFHKEHYKNLKRTIDRLLLWQAVPIINENDAIATYGLKLGDNDTLAALIAAMYPQSLLILLTTIDGFYMNGQKMDLLSEITSEHMKAAGSPSAGGIGGMRTKIRAAKKILQSGQIMNICSGQSPQIIASILQGNNEGTWFYNASTKANAKRRWILHNNRVQGSLQVDAGAREALLKKNASLLGVGILSFQGKFAKGDVVEIKDSSGQKFAKGIIACDWKTLQKSLQAGSFAKGDEIVHRDNCIILY